MDRHAPHADDFTADAGISCQVKAADARIGMEHSE